jgi:hypothetical protein
MASSWSQPVSTDEAQRRASGRRRHNALRHIAQARRRTEVARRLAEMKRGLPQGIQTELARELGVAPSTICRDIAALLREHRLPCPHCGSTYWPKGLPRFLKDEESF